MLSIIIPAHNEEARIGKTLESYVTWLRREKEKKNLENFNIIAVANACNDKTAEIVKKISKDFKEIKLLNFQPGGKGFAVKEGFIEAVNSGSDLIGFVDADMATSPKAFFDLVKNIGSYDGIIGSRYVKGSIVSPKQPFQRVIASRAFNFIVRSLFLFPFKDTQCLPSFSEIFVTIDGTAVKNSIEEIKDKIELVLVKKSKNFEIYNIKNDVKIPSLNKKEKKIELVPATGFIVRRDKYKKLIKIELEGGRTFSVSEKHPLLIFENGEFYEKASNQLKEGDLLPVVKEWNLKTKINYLDLIEYIKNQSESDIKVQGWRSIVKIRPLKLSKKFNISLNKAYSWYLHDRIPIKYYLALEKKPNMRDKLSLCFGGGKHTIPAKIKISKELLRLLGYYISEGCCSIFDSKNRSRHVIRISFNKNEIELIKETKKLLSLLFNIKTSLEKKGSCITLSAYSRILCYLFKEIFKTGINAFNKKVPAFVYCLDQEKIGNFIDTYFLGDGNISLHKQANSINIRANSASEKLIKDLQLLLLRLGITINVGYNKREKTIMKRKIKKLNKLRWNLRIHAGSNIKKFEELCPSIKEKYHFLFSKFKNKFPSLYERSSRNIENSDICFVKIKKIKIIKYSGKWYDFKIQSDKKPYENFMHDAGILSHNCGAKLFRRKTIEDILPSLSITKWAFDIDMLYNAKRKGFKIKEYPTIWSDAIGSKIKLQRASIQMLFAVVRLRLLNSRFKNIWRLTRPISGLLYKITR